MHHKNKLSNRKSKPQIISLVAAKMHKWCVGTNYSFEANIYIIGVGAKTSPTN